MPYETRQIDAQAALGAGATTSPAVQRRLDDDEVSILIDVTAVTGNLDVTIEWAPTDAGPWAVADTTPDAFAAINAPSTVVKTVPARAEYMRLAYNVTTGPASFTVWESA